VYPGDLSRGQAYVHLDDTLNAIRLAVERRRQLAPDTTFFPDGALDPWRGVCSAKDKGAVMNSHNGKPSRDIDTVVELT
jgi:hypothetical protein